MKYDINVLNNNNNASEKEKSIYLLYICSWLIVDTTDVDIFHYH